MSSDKVGYRRNPEKALGRIESFSDSIFGFAITLLVLDLLQIPRSEIGLNFVSAFYANWQHFFSFLVGFCTIMICWINHHHVFCYIVQYDGKFLWINGMLLLIVTFTPLPTSLFSEFLLEENNIGLRLFGLTYFLIACVANLIWMYPYKKGFLDMKEDDSYYKSILALFRSAVYYTLLAFIICFISSTIAMIMYAILFSVFAFPHHFALRLKQYFAKPRNKSHIDIS
ncbi:MAG TPA: TMEM175 family protein [Chryseosolibacter sp.]